MSIIRDLIENTRDFNDSSASNRLNSIGTSKMIAGETVLTDTLPTLVYTGYAYDGTGVARDIVTGIGSKDLNYSATVTYSNISKSNLGFDRATFKLYVYINVGAASGTTLTDTNYWREALDDEVFFWDNSDVWIKSRDVAYDHKLFDTIRGVGNQLITSTTDSESYTTQQLNLFNSNGFTLGTGLGVNENTHTYIAWQNYYNKVMITTTNHGKRALVAFNDVSNQSITLYQGSGVAGHEIKHGLGQVVDLSYFKNLSNVTDWPVYNKQAGKDVRGKLNTDGTFDGSTIFNLCDDTTEVMTLTDSFWINALGDLYISYSKASSKSQKIGSYSGTGEDGNFIYCGFKPSYVMIKRKDDVASWLITDNIRYSGGDDGRLYANLSNSETFVNELTMLIDGFSMESNGNSVNALGGDYLFIAYADTNSNDGGSYDDLPTETTNLVINNGILMSSDGFDTNGAINTTTDLGSQLVINPTWEL